jgi:hypothetical protein
LRNDWLIKYYALTVLRKLCIVFNGKDVDEGLTAIELTRKHFGTEARILLYAGNTGVYEKEFAVRMIDA